MRTDPLVIRSGEDGLATLTLNRPTNPATKFTFASGFWVSGARKTRRKRDLTSNLGAWTTPA